MTVHEPPLRAFLEEGRAVEAVVRVAIAEHQEDCPCMRLLQQSTPECCGATCELTTRRPEPLEAELIQQPNHLVADDLQVVQDLSSWALRHGGGVRPPVSTNLVALLDPDRLVYIQEVPMKKRAELLLDGNAWIIRVSKQLGHKSRRFAIMSEGFHLLRKSRLVEVQSYGAVALDWLANRFAAQVLMPERWVRDLWPRAENVPNLAGIFQVSPTAMAIRLRELGLER